MDTQLQLQLLSIRARAFQVNGCQDKITAAKIAAAGCDYMYSLSLVDICTVINTAGDFWWYCLRAVWGRRASFRARLKEEMGKLPAGVVGLEYVVYVVPHLVFYAAPRRDLPGPAVIGRLTIPLEYIWGAIEA